MVDNYKNLLNNIRRYVEISEEEEQRLLEIIKITRIKKRQFIDQPGYIYRYRN